MAVEEAGEYPESEGKGAGGWLGQGRQVMSAHLWLSLTHGIASSAPAQGRCWQPREVEKLSQSQTHMILVSTEGASLWGCRSASEGHLVLPSFLGSLLVETRCVCLSHQAEEKYSQKQGGFHEG